MIARCNDVTRTRIVNVLHSVHCAMLLDLYLLQGPSGSIAPCIGEVNLPPDYIRDVHTIHTVTTHVTVSCVTVPCAIYLSPYTILIENNEADDSPGIHIFLLFITIWKWKNLTVIIKMKNWFVENFSNIINTSSLPLMY